MKWTRRPDGYYHGDVDGVRWCRHRWMWVQEHGPIPEGYTVDHENDTPGDDRMENLQCIPHADNVRLGTASLAAHNASGFNCVYLDKQAGQYRGQFVLRGVTINCGRHATAELANAVVFARRKELNAPTRRVA